MMRQKKCTEIKKKKYKIYMMWQRTQHKIKQQRMDEEPSISGGITRSIPQELQDDIDIIAAKSLPKEGIIE